MAGKGVPFNMIEQQLTPTLVEAIQNCPLEIRTLILQKLFALSEDVQALFHIQHLLKSAKVVWEPYKASVRTLHVTISSARVPPTLDAFVRSFPSVEHLKVTFVVDKNRREIEAPEFTGWLRHWQQSLTTLSVEVQVPPGFDKCCEQASDNRFSGGYTRKQVSLCLQYTPLTVEGWEAYWRLCEEDRTVWSEKDAHLMQMARLSDAVRQSRIEFLSIRNLHKAERSLGDLSTTLWAGSKIKHLRWEDECSSGFQLSRRVSRVLTTTIERLELVCTGDPCSRSDGHRTRIVKVDCRGPLRHFSYTDTSTAQAPVRIEMLDPWKLETLQFLSRRPTVIISIASEKTAAAVNPRLTPIEERVHWELRNLVIDTGLQHCLFEPHRTYRVWPALETLSAVVSKSALLKLPATLQGLRGFCPKLKKVTITVEGKEFQGFGVWATGVTWAHAAAGNPFELTIAPQRVSRPWFALRRIASGAWAVSWTFVVQWLRHQDV